MALKAERFNEMDGWDFHQALEYIDDTARLVHEHLIARQMTEAVNRLIAVSGAARVARRALLKQMQKAALVEEGTVEDH